MKVGVAGIGSMGRNHLRVYRSLGCRVSVYDTNPAAKKVAAMYDAKFFGNGEYEQFLVDVENGLSICTPNASHKELAGKALELGIPTLVEKPLAPTSKEAKELAETAKEYGAVLAVGHIERYNPVFIKLKNLLEGEEIIAASAKRWGQARPTIAEAGVILDLAIHDIDLTYYLTGVPIKDVYCSSQQLENAVLVLGHGKFNTELSVLWHQNTRRREWDTTTTNDSYSVDAQEQILRKHTRFVGPAAPSYDELRRYGGFEILPVQQQEPLILELRSFLAAATRNAGKQEKGAEALPPIVSPEDAIRAIEIVEAAHLSAKEGRKVIL